MDPELSRLNQELEDLRRRIAQLKKNNRGPEPFWSDNPPAKKSLEVARSVLIAFLVLGCLYLLQSLVKLAEDHDEHVFVVRENGHYHVWESSFDYEKATGKVWATLPREDYDHFAEYHPRPRPPSQWITDSLIPCVLFLMLSGFALRSVNRARARLLAQNESDPGPDSTAS